MVAKKVPMRQCTGCREMRSKRDMIRVIKTAEMKFVSMPPDGKTAGVLIYVRIWIV